MKLLTFEHGAEQRLGALAQDGSIIDLTEGGPGLRSMQTLIEAGAEALERAREIVAKAPSGIAPGSVRWLAPLPRPVQMRDFLVFEEHMRMSAWMGAKLREQKFGMGPAPAAPLAVPPIWYQQPIYYKCNRFAVAGPDIEVDWPEQSSILDYELELACVIGRGGRDISAAAAGGHIFGYTILNDLSARDLQSKDIQGGLGPGKSKDFDNANILGPVIVTADALDVSKLEMRASVNGELWSLGSSATMHWSFEQMIEHLSCGETLHPGEILGSGTVGGGCGLELGRFLMDGDVVSLAIEGIGELTTRIRAPHVIERLWL